MKCLSCLTENDSALRHCEKCGALLPVIKRGFPLPGKTALMVMAVLLACAGIIAYFFQDIVPPAFHITGTISPAEPKGTAGNERRKQGPAPAAAGDITTQQSAVPDADASAEDLNVIAGWVTITDPWGMQVNRFRAGLAGSGWLALPSRACLGGNSWHFYPDTGGKVAISGGLWVPGDRAGLWHITENPGSAEGPELAPWDNRESVSWMSLESDDAYDPVTLRPGRAEGFFVSAALPEHIHETGIFLQNNRIVGWSFGRSLPKAYMWAGKTGTDLKYRTWVGYFYKMTFANSREEKFAMTLAMQKKRPVLEQIASFIEGFMLQPKLSAEDTPHYLLKEEIVKQLRGLVAEAVRSGEERGVADMLDSRALKGISDIDLLVYIVPAIARVRGTGAAIAEIEDTGRDLTRGTDVPALNALHLKLYQELLRSLVSEGAGEEGRRTYRAATAFYPDDPYIHLLGVELALLDEDWKEAEQQLYIRDYPPAFQDRYRLLALRIEELKGREGRIVISFSPGSDRITVTAGLNGTLRQAFLVDTGATIVTIPSSAADALGLKTAHGSRTLSTASGTVTVREVVIDSIDINGWTEHDVRAVVLDMPGQPGLGLLGLNYLGRFRMDMRTEDGILTLTPR